MPRRGPSMLSSTDQPGRTSVERQGEVSLTLLGEKGPASHSRSTEADTFRYVPQVCWAPEDSQGLLASPHPLRRQTDFPPLTALPISWGGHLRNAATVLPASLDQLQSCPLASPEKDHGREAAWALGTQAPRPLFSASFSPLWRTWLAIVFTPVLHH